MCEVYDAAAQFEVLKHSKYVLECMLDEGHVIPPERYKVEELYNSFLLTRRPRESYDFVCEVYELDIDDDLKIDMARLPNRTRNIFRLTKNIDLPVSCDECSEGDRKCFH